MKQITQFSLEGESPTLIPRFTQFINTYQANIYLLKVNNRNTKKRCEICSKLTIKTPERRQ